MWWQSLLNSPSSALQPALSGGKNNPVDGAEFSEACCRLIRPMISWRCPPASQLASLPPASALYVNYVHCCQANQPCVNAAALAGGGGSSGNMVTASTMDTFWFGKQIHIRGSDLQGKTLRRQGFWKNKRWYLVFEGKEGTGACHLVPSGSALSSCYLVTVFDLSESNPSSSWSLAGNRLQFFSASRCITSIRNSTFCLSS